MRFAEANRHDMRRVITAREKDATKTLPWEVPESMGPESWESEIARVVSPPCHVGDKTLHHGMIEIYWTVPLGHSGRCVKV